MSTHNRRKLKETVELFIRRGANVKATNRWGNSCLHTFFGDDFSSHSTANHDYEGDQGVLLLLVERGADVLARNDAGEFIWEAAKLQNPIDPELHWNSYFHDLWDSVIALSGHDLFDFHKTHMKGYSRVGRYCDCYTRAEFEELWKGNEHLCPYYDEGPEEYLGSYCRYFVASSESDWSIEDETGLNTEHIRDHSHRSESSGDEERHGEDGSDRGDCSDNSAEPEPVEGDNFVSSPGQPEEETIEREGTTTPRFTSDIRDEDMEVDKPGTWSYGTTRVTYDWNVELEENPWG